MNKGSLRECWLGPLSSILVLSEEALKVAEEQTKRRRRYILGDFCVARGGVILALKTTTHVLSRLFYCLRFSFGSILFHIFQQYQHVCSCFIETTSIIRIAELRAKRKVKEYAHIAGARNDGLWSSHLCWNWTHHKFHTPSGAFA